MVNHKNVDFMWPVLGYLIPQKLFMPCIKQEYQNNVLIEEYTITIFSSVCGQIFKRFLERNEITILLRTVGKI